MAAKDTAVRRLDRLSLVLLVLSSATGCQMLMYPLARAFGGAKESELKICRQAFTEMKGEIRDRSIVVFPPLVVGPEGEPVWNVASMSGEAEFLRAQLGASVGPASENPDIPYQPMERNQLRYFVKRARLYSGWVSSRHPAGDFFVFTEVLRGRTIGAGQIYVIDETGRIAHARFFNSHHFDPAKMTSVDAFVQWMLGQFLGDLEEDPLKIFPRYGVG